MTAGQQLIEQGIQQGRQEERQRLLLQFLRQRFGDEVDAQVERRIAAASGEQMEVWIMRVLSAATTSELLAD